jgi:precorrin-2/cobalt-factor-2 C20-methyltransferase
MSGTIHGVGLGPGAADLMSVRADRLVRHAPHRLFPQGRAARPCPPHRGRSAAPRCGGNRDGISRHHRNPVSDPRYNACLAAFYADCTQRLADLARASDVVVLCEGDPFFYGSFMHLHSRLTGQVPVQVVPGITGMAGAWNATGLPITWGDDVLTVAMATLPEPNSPAASAIPMRWW